MEQLKLFVSFAVALILDGALLCLWMILDVGLKYVEGDALARIGNHHAIYHFVFSYLFLLLALSSIIRHIVNQVVAIRIAWRAGAPQQANAQRASVVANQLIDFPE